MSRASSLKHFKSRLNKKRIVPNDHQAVKANQRPHRRNLSISLAAAVKPVAALLRFQAMFIRDV